MKTYVVDTSVLIQHPDIMYELGGAKIIIPTSVIKELDGLKKDEGLAAQAARKIARTLDRLGSYGDLAGGMKLSTGGVLMVYPGYELIDDLASDVDNRVVGASMKLKSETGEATLLTNDNNMRTISRVHGVRSEFYPFGMNFDWMEGKIVPETEPETQIKEMEREDSEDGRKYLLTFLAVVAIVVLIMAVI